MFVGADGLAVKQDLTVMEQLYNASRTNDTVKHVQVTKSMSPRLTSAKAKADN
jgi:hypothetical protein